MVSNPYLSRIMIQDPDRFYGRRREISRICSRIGGDPPQSVSVVGERRIGKSSLLYHLSLAEVLKSYSQGAPPLVVFLDFQQLRQISPDQFFEFVLERVAQAGSVSGTLSGGPAAFQSLLVSLARQRLKLVLILDEFDAITSNPAFGADFFSFLRSLANHYPVAYVTSSKTELQRLCHSSSIADSPFFNIFTNLYLRPFEREEALELIRIPSQNHGIPLAAYENEILRLAGFFPFYLQIACCAYFDWLEEHPGEEPDSEGVTQRFLEEAGPHFSYFWERSPVEIRLLVKRIILGRQPTEEDSHLCARLQRDGYLLQEGPSFRLFSPVFGEYLSRLSDFTEPGRSTGAGRPARGGDPLEPGSEIHQYRILSKAGEGGMGVIYQAEDSSLKRLVALKMIRPELLEVATTRRRFLQEAQSTAALNHSTIATIYEFFEHEDRVALVMEWVEGATLKTRILNDGPVAPDRLTEWMIQICDGLETAHRRHIIHRDIKSSNLMITPENQVKILDFGLAKHIPPDHTLASGITAQGSFLGTLDYMSPEQISGDEVDARSDLFSLGVVFFEGLTGKLPFQRRTAPATLQAILHDPPPSLDLYRVEEAERIQPILRKLLEKTPGRRYGSADQVRRDLTDLARPGGKFRWPRIFRGT